MKSFLPLALFTALLALTCYVAELHHTIRLRPQSVHVWRQCDGASYTLNYYQLVKISEGIIFVAIAMLVLTAGYLKNGFATIENRDRMHRIIGIAIVWGLALGWSMFATYYNKINHTGQNLLGIYPIWRMPWQEIKQAINRATGEAPGFWRASFHHSFVLHLIGWSQLIFLLFFRQMHPLLRSMTVLLLLGVIGYALLWFNAFYHHDYYMLPLVVYPVFLLLTVLEYFARLRSTAFSRVLLTSLCALAVATGVWHNGRIQHERYHDPLYLAMSINPAVYELEPYLRSIGLKHTDKVVSVPDGSPNISLYLMNQPGWTEIFNSPGYDIYYFQSKGAKYLIVNDSTYLQKPPYHEFIKNKIGEYKGVYVFDI
jgi:uncharacterized membrane protein